MILMIDNYDSFTYNLVDYLEQLGEEVIVKRNDQVSISAIEDLAPEVIVISPGPKTPEQAGISKQTIKEFKGQIPILGICLGHQTIATVNYFSNFYARKKTKQAGYDDALFLNSDNFILEATIANIFFIKGEIIYTPTSDLDLLPGIIREKIITIAEELGLRVKEVILEKLELALFDFAFITNSLVGLMRVNKIDTIKYEDKSDVFKQLKVALKDREMRR